MHPILRSTLHAGIAAIAALLLHSPGTVFAGSSSGFSYSNDLRSDGFSYALISPGSNVTFSDMDGDHRDAFDRLQEDADRDLMWFSIDGRGWVVEDARVLDRANAICEPMRTLGKAQGRLGRRQGELGREQGRLGREQGELGRRQALLSARITEASLASRGGSSYSRSALRREMTAIGERQRELGRRQSELGAIQSRLGEEQRVLGEQQRAASKKARVEMRRLAEDAIARGLAHRMDLDTD
jgi:hypothetical protein